VEFIISPSKSYQKGALVFSSKLESIILKLCACQTGYLNENVEFLTTTFLVSFKTDSPSKAPAKTQFSTFVSFKLYNALSFE
jgi:hypothetical protein